MIQIAQKMGINICNGFALSPGAGAKESPMMGLSVLLIMGYILGTHADEEGINIYDPLNKKNNRKFGYDKFKGTNASIIPQTAGITIPTETAKQALNKKNANKDGTLKKRSISQFGKTPCFTEVEYEFKYVCK